MTSCILTLHDSQHSNSKAANICNRPILGLGKLKYRFSMTLAGSGLPSELCMHAAPQRRSICDSDHSRSDKLVGESVRPSSARNCRGAERAWPTALTVRDISNTVDPSNPVLYSSQGFLYLVDLVLSTVTASKHFRRSEIILSRKLPGKWITIQLQYCDH